MKKNFVRDLLNRHRRGQSMLEFALAIPVFLLLVLGIIEFGRMFLMYTSVFASAREGARYGAAVETLCDPTGLEAAARRVGFFAGDVTVSIQYDDGLGNLKSCEQTVLGDRVHVTASISYRSITGIIPQMTLRSTARRTIVKQVFLAWTLEPTSANVGGVPPTNMPNPPTNIPEPPTSIPTVTDTPDPNATPTNTPTVTRTATATSTPLPPECIDDWSVNSTSTTIYYDFYYSNPDPNYIYQLTVVSISWDMSGGKVLNHIEFKTPTGDFERVWTGPTGSGYLYWYPQPPLPIYYNPDFPSVLRFVFKKEDVTVTNITLVVSGGSGSCTIYYP